MAPVWIKLVSEFGERQDDASSEGCAVIFRFDAPPPASGVDGDGRAVRSALLHEALASLPGYRHDAGGAGYALKLRNSRGSLVPVVGRSLPSNSANSPHTLELVRLGGRAAETSSQASSSQASSSHDVVAEALRRRLSAIGGRLSVLEECCDRDGARRGMKSHVDEELFHLKQRMDFLLLRSQASESADWEGMFRRNPMW